MMWSSVPKVRSGMRTLSFESLSIWKACGVVTSWIRCRPIRSWVWPDGSVRTVCASQTLSSSVRAMWFLLRRAYAAPGSPCSPVKGSALNGKLRFMVDAALFPALETLLAPAPGWPARRGECVRWYPCRDGDRPATRSPLSRNTEAHDGIADQQRSTKLHRRDHSGQDQ